MEREVTINEMSEEELRHTKDCVGFLRDYRRASAWLDGAWYSQGVREWNCVLRHRRPELSRKRDSNEDFTYRTSIMNADLDKDNWEITLDRVVFMGYAGRSSEVLGTPIGGVL